MAAGEAEEARAAAGDAARDLPTDVAANVGRTTSALAVVVGAAAGGRGDADRGERSGLRLRCYLAEALGSRDTSERFSTTVVRTGGESSRLAEVAGVE